MTRAEFLNLQNTLKADETFTCSGQTFTKLVLPLQLIVATQDTGLNIRQEPGIDTLTNSSKILGRVAKGTVFPTFFQSSKQGWFPISFSDGTFGFLSDTYATDYVEKEREIEALIEDDSKPLASKLQAMEAVGIQTPPTALTMTNAQMLEYFEQQMGALKDRPAIPATTGLSTTAKVAIGVGAVIVIGLLAAIALKK